MSEQGKAVFLSYASQDAARSARGSRLRQGCGARGLEF
jgi:hypothetical protein